MLNNSCAWLSMRLIGCLGTHLAHRSFFTHATPSPSNSLERLRLGSEWQDHGLVFPTSIGTPYTLSSLTNKWLKPALVKAELTGFNLYSLRHTHATLLLANGENAKVASERLGHSTIVLTLDTYSHVLPDMQQQAADRLEDLLFGKAS